MCQNTFFLSLQGIKMSRSKREEQKKDVYLKSRLQQKLRRKRIQSPEKKKFMAQKNIKIT